MLPTPDVKVDVAVDAGVDIETVPADWRAKPAERQDWRTIIFHVFLVFFAGVLIRIPFHLAYNAVWSGDSPGYAAFYSLWVHRLFFLGERTPVYPFFLGFAQWLAGVQSQPILALRASQTVIVLQSVLGVLTAVLFYFALRTLRISNSVALGASLFFATMPAICLYEVNILNMSLSCSLMVVIVALFFAKMKRLETGQRITAPALATGIALSLSVLNRPDLLIFAILLLLTLAAAILRARAQRAAGFSIADVSKSLVLLAVPVACSVLGWMLLMYVGIGQFRITTLDGWNRSRTVYNMFDRVDPEDRVIGGIMSQTYSTMVREHADTNLREIMWQAQDDLLGNLPQYPITDTATDPAFLNDPIIRKGRSALGFILVPCEVKPAIYCWQAMRGKIDTGDYLGKVSWKLARKYPADWLHNVGLNFFEESFNFRYTDSKPAVEGFQADSGNGSIVRNGGLASITSWAVSAEAPLLTLLYCVTLAFFFSALLVLLRAPDQHWLRDMSVATLVVASVGTIVGTCVLAGFNRVYTLPHLAVFTVVAAYVWESRSRLRAAVLGRS